MAGRRQPVQYLVHYAFLGARRGAVDRVIPVASLPPKLYGNLCLVGNSALAFAVHRWIERPVSSGSTAGSTFPAADTP